VKLRWSLIYNLLATGEQFSLASSITEDGARLDISANGFWDGQCEKTYIDVKFSILMLQVIDPPMPTVFTENMNCLRNAHMKHASLRLNIAPSHF